MRFGLLLGLTVGVGLVSVPARAQGVDEFGAYGGLEDGAAPTPQTMAFELRVGRYVPSVDEEFESATPFADTFGNDSRYLIGVEFDWQALRIPHLGSFGPGFGWGYTKLTANALLANGGGKRSDQETSLTLMPMYAVGVLRVDVVARETPVPLAVYAKAGLGYALWWVGNGADTAEAGGKVGRGASYGWQYALGGMVLLDPIDRTSAVTIDATSGVNHSYFFMEWYRSQLDGFGGGKMQVGANTWMLGLALEM